MSGLWKIAFGMGCVAVAVVLFWMSRSVVYVDEDSYLWKSEIDARRANTIYPGPGKPKAPLRAGDELVVLRISTGKDYRAYHVIAPGFTVGWVKHGQLQTIPLGWTGGGLRRTVVAGCWDIGAEQQPACDPLSRPQEGFRWPRGRHLTCADQRDIHGIYKERGRHGDKGTELGE